MNWNCWLISSPQHVICSQIRSSNIKVPQHQHGLFSNQPQLQKNSHFRFPPKPLFATANYLPSPKPGQLGKLLSVSQLLQTPVLNPPKKILKTCAEKAAILLAGGLFFLLASFGCNCKPSLAIPTSESSMEEKMDAQDEDEMNWVKLLEKNPRDVETLKVVLSKKMMKGKRKEAVEYVERLIEVEPDEVEWRLLQALSYEMMGNLSKAKRLFNDILEERPLLLRALHGLAMVMHKNVEGPAVFEMLHKALELAQREKRVTEERNIRILIAQMHVVKGELEEALKKFRDLVDENPKDFRPYLCQGIIYSLMNKKKEAEEEFETYRSLVPEEFPQRGFLDDVVLAAKTEPQERLKKEFRDEFSPKIRKPINT